MPPKKQEKKQIIAIFQPSPYWKYTKYPQELLDKADNFITTFQNQLKLLIDQQKSVNQNYETLAQKMGIDVHPCLVYHQKQQNNYPNLKSTDYGQRYITFLNHKIDSITLKLVTFLTTSYKINTIKLSNNDLSNQLIQLRKLIQKQDSLVSLYFQWNSLINVQGRVQFFNSLYLGSLKHLILRQCQMGNQIVINIINRILSNPASNLVSLDLYGNKLTNDVSSVILKLVEQGKKIQFLGLSKNYLNSHEFLKSLTNSIGQIPLSEQQYMQHKLKEKQRDQIIEKNKKRKKGTPEEPLPFLFQIKQKQKIRFYIKNLTLKVLNLSGNGIKDSVNKQSNVQVIKDFVENQGRNVELFIQGNSFTKKSKQMFKFYQNIYF